MSLLQLDPTPCNEGALKQLFAQATDLGTLVEPYPIFFGNPQCNSSGGNSSINTIGTDAKVFPNYYKDVAESNILSVIQQSKFDNYVKSGFLGENDINILSKANGSYNQIPISFKSWYVPPHYELYFFKHDPSTTSFADQKDAYIRFGPDTLVVAACQEVYTLKNGTKLFEYTSMGSLANKCIKATMVTNFIIVVKREDFPALLLDICAKNKIVNIGTSSLNDIWKPQTSSCDQLITYVCKHSDVSIFGDQFSELCDCFDQQEELDLKYGKQLGVPVCCFGTNKTNSNRNCEFNKNAYKTESMLKNCCTFAECQSIIKNSKDIQEKTSGASMICAGNKVTLPTIYVTPLNITQTKEIKPVEHQVIPNWVWYIFISSVVLFVIFLINLAFVRQMKSFNANLPAQRISNSNYTANITRMENI